MLGVNSQKRHINVWGDVLRGLNRMLCFIEGEGEDVSEREGEKGRKAEGNFGGGGEKKRHIPRCLATLGEGGG